MPLVVREHRDVGRFVRSVVEDVAEGVDGEEAQAGIETGGAGANEPGDARESADHPAVPVGHGVDDLVPERCAQIAREALAEDDAGIPARSKHRAVDHAAQEGERQGVFRRRIERDEPGAVALPRCRQHRLAVDPVHDAGHVRVLCREGPQSIGAGDRARQRRSVEVLGVLQGDMTRAQPRRQVDEVVPVPVLHGGGEDRQQHAEPDR